MKASILGILATATLALLFASCAGPQENALRSHDSGSALPVHLGSPGAPPASAPC